MEKGSRRRDKKNGLIPGDKIKNQVGVPDFVYSNTNYIVRGLKGLYDTDGGITVNLDKRIVLNFENHSVTLLRDFQHMCNKIGVNATLSIKSNQVSITETSSVKKILYSKSCKDKFSIQKNLVRSEYFKKKCSSQNKKLYSHQT